MRPPIRPGVTDVDDFGWAPRLPVLAMLAQGRLLVLVAPDFAPRVVGEVPDGHGLGWSPRADAIAVASHRRALTVLELDGRQRWGDADADDPFDPSWSPNGALVATTGDGVTVRDARDGSVKWRSLRRTPTEVKTLEAGTGKLSVAFDERTRGPEHLFWSPDSTLLAAEWQFEFRVLRAETGELVAHGPTLELPHLKGRRLGWGREGDALYEERGNRLAQWSFATSAPWVNGPAFSDDGNCVAAEGQQHCLHVTRWVTSEVVLGHPRTIEGLAWSPNGTLATVCRDGIARLLRPTGSALEELGRLDAGWGLAWSADGRWLATSSCLFACDD